jgi:hypothetical protein
MPAGFVALLGNGGVNQSPEGSAEAVDEHADPQR